MPKDKKDEEQELNIWTWQELTNELYQLLRKAKHVSDQVDALDERRIKIEHEKGTAIAYPRACKGFFLLATMIESLQRVRAGQEPIDLLMNRPPWGWRL
jgi:hypothetical protein